MSEKKYFTYFNKEEAKEYIGRKCRFSDLENNLTEDWGTVGVLSDVSSEKNPKASFCTSDLWFRFCTPIETRFRPYKNFEELARDAIKHGFDDDGTFKIKDKNENKFRVVLLPNGVGYYLSTLEDNNISFSEMAEKFTWFDGTPCGVEEEA